MWIEAPLSHNLNAIFVQNHFMKWGFESDTTRELQRVSDKAGVTWDLQDSPPSIHIDLQRQTFEGVYFSHHCVPHSLAVIFPTVFNTGSPQSEALPSLWELLRSPEPQVIPGGLDIRNTAFQPDILPREDP